MTVEFVSHPDFGYGRRLVEARSISFFDTPAASELLMPEPEPPLPAVTLEKYQRVWWHSGNRWQVGYVYDIDDAAGRAYWVSFPNMETRRISADELRVRWAFPVSDPVTLLGARIAESRILHRYRAQFVRESSDQLVACEGMYGLWSAGVDLYAHQIGAARRVLTDPVRRYLLADEVGLGKTIEAGMVIRQILLDEEGEILVAAPAGLIDQWNAELTSKFRIDTLGDRVSIISHEDLESVPDKRWLLVVVDEAHRVTTLPGGATEPPAYQSVRRLCRSAEAVLLLTATPVRSNEDGFLRMLHLLDPVSYCLDDLASFRRRVTIRDDLATALMAMSDDAPIMFLDEPIATLRALLPEEGWLQAQLHALSAAIDTHDRSTVQLLCRRIRRRLSETHRIHHRMVRTRRTPTLARLFPVRGRRLHGFVIDSDPRRRALLEAFERFRVSLGPTMTDGPLELLRVVVARLTGPVDACEKLGRALRSQPIHDLSAAEITAVTAYVDDPKTRAFADDLLTICAEPSTNDRYAAMVEWIWPKVTAGRVAVTSSFTASAQRAADHLEEKFGTGRVARYLETMSSAERATSYERFLHEPGVSIIVLDASGEEGLNLQSANDVLHLDIPVDLSRLEQRLGRFDRWATARSAQTGPVRSTVFRDADPQVEAHLGAWCMGVSDGAGVFQNSIATLQYVLPDYEERFLATTFDVGLEEAGIWLADARDEIERLRRSIVSQDMLDSIEDRAEDEKLLEAMTGADAATRIRQSVRGYVVHMLQFSENTDEEGTRFGVSTLKPPLLPESEVHGLGTQALRRRYTFDRHTSAKGTSLIRAGEPLLDRLLDLAARDDRGRSFAVEVPQIGRSPGDPPLPFFYFDVVIDPDTEPVDELAQLDPAAGAAARIRLGRAFPRRFETVWLTPDLAEAPPEFRRRLAQTEGANLGSRTERFEELTRAVQWDALCERAACTAISLATRREGVVQHIERAMNTAKSSRDYEQEISLARQVAGMTSSTNDAVLDTVVRAVDNAIVRIDACGVVIVTAPEVTHDH